MGFSALLHPWCCIRPKWLRWPRLPLLGGWWLLSSILNVLYPPPAAVTALACLCMLRLQLLLWGNLADQRLLLLLDSFLLLLMLSFGDPRHSNGQSIFLSYKKSNMISR